MSKISVIVPTCNRESLLQDSILSLVNIVKKDVENQYEIVIVDSSDISVQLNNYDNFQIKIIATEIQSAALQRNIGLKYISATTDFVAFLDDDVIIPEDYFKNLKNSLVKNNAIGISGIVLKKHEKDLSSTNPVRKFIKKVLFLDSKNEGSLLLSGVNIPCTTANHGVVKSYWLIGCSLWDFKKIELLSFEEDFYGQSLGEDVIFSYKASKKGDLYVDTDVLIIHLESELGRQNFRSYTFQWFNYRYRLREYRDKKFSLYFANGVCTGAKLIHIFSYLFFDRDKFKQGTLGYLDFLNKRVKHEN